MALQGNDAEHEGGKRLLGLNHGADGHFLFILGGAGLTPLISQLCRSGWEQGEFPDFFITSIGNHHLSGNACRRNLTYTGSGDFKNTPDAGDEFRFDQKGQQAQPDEDQTRQIDGSIREFGERVNNMESVGNRMNL